MSDFRMMTGGRHSGHTVFAQTVAEREGAKIVMPDSTDIPMIVCPLCQGSGMQPARYPEPDNQEQPCTACQGAGKVAAGWWELYRNPDKSYIGPCDDCPKCRSIAEYERPTGYVVLLCNTCYIAEKQQELARRDNAQPGDTRAKHGLYR